MVLVFVIFFFFFFFQFSGAVGEDMVECYSVFCSHHNESMSFYKEQLQNSKKMQHLVRVSRAAYAGRAAAPRANRSR